jgi:hypothetical protein
MIVASLEDFAGPPCMARTIRLAEVEQFKAAGNCSGRNVDINQVGKASRREFLTAQQP